MNWFDICGVPHERTFAHDCRLSSLPNEWERELAALWRVETDVFNGAYLQFLTNWGQESYLYSSRALNKIGARKKADIVDRCQALVDEHFDWKGKSNAELLKLLPNAVLDSEGKQRKAPGSVLPEAVVARIYELSYEYMNCPDDVEQLARKYYRSHIPELEQCVKEKETEARKKREGAFAILEADLRAAEQVNSENVKQGKACPKCGFSYSWNEGKCGHCHYHRE